MRYFGILCAVKAHAIATTFTFGGNPVVSSKVTSYFNDMLGTTLGAKAKGKKYSAAALTAFGEGADVWNRVAGEDMSSLWIWDTPSDLRDAIIKMNGSVNHKIVE